MLDPIPVADKLIANKNTAGAIAHERDIVGSNTVPFHQHATTYDKTPRRQNYETACVESNASRIFQIRAWSLELPTVVIFGVACSHRPDPRETNAQIRAKHNRGTQIQHRDSHFFSFLPSFSFNCFNNNPHAKSVEPSCMSKYYSLQNCMQYPSVVKNITA